MSRSQEGNIVDTGNAQNSTYFNNAQNSYSNAQADVGDYEKQLGDYAASVNKFASSNPYTQGGEFQTATNQQLSNTADAGARSAGQTLQGEALRTGQNSAGAIAATEAMQNQNTRNLGADEAAATQNRIGSEAGYNAQAVGQQGNLTSASAVPEQMEAGLASSQAGAGNQALSTAAGAAKTPSWTDEFGDSFAQSLGQTLGGHPGSKKS